VAEIAFPALGIPGWAMSVVVVLSILGFPVALVLTWAFDITPEGLRRTRAGDSISAVAGAGEARASLRWAVGVGTALVFLIAAVYVGRVMPTGGLGSDTDSIRSLAVVPFQNLSGDPDQEYVAAGMTDVLTTTLGTLGSLRVISRQSTMEFQGSSATPARIASELGVDALISGSVLRVGDDVRIIAQLLDARTNVQVWSDSYDGNAGEIFALQGETARTIADQIQLAITPEEQLALESDRSITIEAFSEALDLEPNFASAHAGLAGAYMLSIQFGHLAGSEYAPRARAEAEEALRLDATLAEAHISVANLDYRGGRDWDGLEARFLRAIELNPSLADAWHYYSHYLMSTLRVDEAIDAALRGVEVDPLARSMRLHLSVTYRNARRWDDVIPVALETLERFPDYSRISLVLGAAYLAKGQFEEALAEIEAVVAVSREFDNVASLGVAYASAGREEEARQVLEELFARGGPPSHVASVYRALGEMDLAFEWLERAVDANQGVLADLLIDPRLDAYRADPPRWRALLERAGFSEGLIEQAMAMG
jgi:TolB-like protein/tetratricopeptide (TPR) repeat protein